MSPFFYRVLVRATVSCGVALNALACAPASAATLTWGTSGTGGTGNWNTLSTSNWWNGSSNVQWTSGADDAWFTGTPGTVTLTTSNTARSLTFDSYTGLYTLALNGQTLAIGGGGITMNASSGSATLSGDGTVLLTAAQTWTNNSTVGLLTVSSTVNNNGFGLTLAGSGSTSISGTISGSGGLTKTGAGTLFLSGTNTFTGQLAVQSGTLSTASINNTATAGVLGAADSSLPVLLGSSGTTATLRYTGASVNITKAFSLATGGTGAFDVSTVVNLQGVISGSGGFVKLGSGTLQLSSNPAPYTGQFTGPTSVSAGRLELRTQYALQNSPYDTTGNSATVGLTFSSTSGMTTIGGLMGNVNLATAISNYGTTVSSLTLNPQAGTSVTYSGVIANGTSTGMPLVKSGPGTQTLTGSNTYTGTTSVYAGTLGVGGATGSIATSGSIRVLGGVLALDNSAGWADRIGNAVPVSLGSLTLTGSASTSGTESFGATSFAVGGKVTVANGSGARTDLAMGAVTRASGAAIDFVGTGGTLGGGANSPNVTSTSLPANTNGILPWATVGGTQWAENNSNSVRAYSGGFVDPTSFASASGSNAQLSGGGTLTSAKTFNSLNVIATAPGQSFTLNSGANLTTGAILKSGAAAYSITGSGTIGTGTELIAHVDGGALTISAPLNTTNVGIAKGGTGDLVLSGTRLASMSGAISIAGGQLEFQSWGTALTGTLSGGVSGAGGITVNLNPSQRLTLSGSNGTNTYSGPTIVRSGVLQLGTNSSNTGIPVVNAAAAVFNGAGSGVTSNIELNGGSLTLLSGYSSSSTAPANFFLGSGPGQIQLTGGTSGISCGATSSGGANTWIINNDSNYEVVWGSPFFKPDALLLGDANGAALCPTRIPNKFDLNGATRTIVVTSTVAASVSGGVNPGTGGHLPGVIRDSQNSGAGLIKVGVGTLDLSGLNTFTGPMTITGGTLAANIMANGGAASSIGASSSAASNLLLANGVTLRYAPSVQAGAGGGATSTDRSFTISGTANGATATLDASGSGAISFTNTAGLAYGTANQTRTLVLSGTNTGANTLAALIADNGTGMVSIVKSGSGTWVLSNANTYTGTTTISTGTLGAGAAAGGQAFGNLSAVTISNTISATLDLNSFSQTIGSLAGGGSAGGSVTTGTLATAVLTTGGDNTSTTFAGVISGSGGLTKAGSGTQILSGANTYTGQTTVNGGVLAAGIANAFGSSAPLAVNSGTVNLGGFSQAVGALSGSAGTLITTNNAAGSATLTTTFASGTSTFAGSIADNGSGTVLFTKSGAGTQILSGTNTFSGATSIAAGVLSITGTSALQGTSDVTIAGGAGLTYTGGAATFGKNVTVTPGSGTGAIRNTGGGVLTLSGTLSKDNSVLRLSGGSFNVTGLITGATPGTSDLVVAGTSSVTLSNTNTYNGPTFVIESSTLSLGINNAIPNSSVVTLGDASSAGTLQLAGFTDSIGGLAFGTGGGTLRLSATSTSAAPLTAASGTMTLTNGTLDLAGSGSTAGLYRVLSAQSIGGSFASITGTSAAYQVITSATSVDYQQRSVLGTVSVTNPATAIITGGSTAFTYTVANSALSGGASLSFTGTGISNVIGTSSGSALAGGTSSAVTGLSFNGVTTGSNQTGTFNVNGSNAFGATTATGTVTVNVFDHASASLTGGTIRVADSIVGYSGTLAGLTSATVANLSGYRVDLKTTGATSGGGVTINNVTAVTQNTSKTISANVVTSASTGANAVNQQFTLTYADDSSLAGTSSNLGSGTVTVQGNVYDHASGSAAGTTIALADSIVGYTGSLLGLTSATISNAAGYRVNLMTTGGTSAGFVNINNVSGVGSGSAAQISASAALTGTQGIGLNSLGQSFNLNYADDSALLGASSNLGTQSITVTGKVLDHALPGFLAGGITDPYAQTTLDINFGSIDETAGVQNFSYNLLNLASEYGVNLTAGLDFTGVTGDGNGFSSGLTTFNNLTAGGTSGLFTATFTPSGQGSFSKTFTLSFFDNQSVTGASARRDLTINASVIVVPEPGAIALAGIGIGFAGWLVRRRRI